MRFLSVNQLVPGTRLARPLYGAGGSILLRENFELTESIICRLKGLGYNGVYVNDEISEGIVIQDVVDEKLRIETANRLEDILKNNGNIEDMQPLVSEVVDSIIDNSDIIINMNRLSGHHKYTYLHSVNVGILSIGIGVKLEYNRDKLIELGMSGMLHDIGKKHVPIDILDKSGTLSKEEFQVIQTHPERGYKMLNNAYNLSSVTKVGVLQHHERFDGSGYPNGLKGHEISMFGRIIAVSDTYDAMTSDRAYHKASQPSEVIEYLFGNGNQRYDLRIVDYFSKCIAVYPIGSCVELSDGTQGIVLKNHMDSVLRPVIRNIQNKQIIDLKNDINYLGICITGLMQ
ncbi:MAG: metal dependent phosphohydrolase [Anaerocolumna sp.]|jgi:HD-GYP domain-containing protein (c-di-GMP phosphodiesterase class II)|nr:metal dependent phosphohydrolase [Anaerocolumna sp.]